MKITGFDFKVQNLVFIYSDCLFVSNVSISGFKYHKYEFLVSRDSLRDRGRA